MIISPFHVGHPAKASLPRRPAPPALYPMVERATAKSTARGLFLGGETVRSHPGGHIRAAPTRSQCGGRPLATKASPQLRRCANVFLGMDLHRLAQDTYS